MGRLFLSEYLSRPRTAHVYKEMLTSGYSVICFEHFSEVDFKTFDSQESAEDYAEDWILQPVSDSTRLWQRGGTPSSSHYSAG